MAHINQHDHPVGWLTVLHCFWLHFSRYRLSFLAAAWLVYYLAILTARIYGSPSVVADPVSLVRLARLILLELASFCSYVSGDTELYLTGIDLGVWIGLGWFVDTLHTPSYKLHLWDLVRPAQLAHLLLLLQLEYATIRCAMCLAAPFLHSLFIGHDNQLRPQPESLSLRPSPSSPEHSSTN